MVVVSDDFLFAFLNELRNLRTLQRHSTDGIEVALVLGLTQTAYGEGSRREHRLGVHIHDIQIHLHLLGYLHRRTGDDVFVQRSRGNRKHKLTHIVETGNTVAGQQLGQLVLYHGLRAFGEVLRVIGCIYRDRQKLRLGSEHSCAHERRYAYRKNLFHKNRFLSLYRYIVIPIYRIISLLK